ncbi:MAG: dependent protein [Actinomycetota bacterium]|nr:dependent protein [Actinomycetota bacterium]
MERSDVLANLSDIRAAIAAAATRSGREPEAVTIVAAAKTVSVEAVRWVVDAGVSAVGENYVSELRAKAPEVPDVRWHFIGTLQRSTAQHVADIAHVVETVSGEGALRRLAARASRAGREVDVLIEVDFTAERSGVHPEDLPAVASLVASLEGVRLRGLMTIPPVPETPEDARPYFRRLRDLRDELHRTNPEVLELSMGMSLDYPIAVEEGATMVRIGTALFGPRTT